MTLLHPILASDGGSTASPHSLIGGPHMIFCQARDCLVTANVPAKRQLAAHQSLAEQGDKSECWDAYFGKAVRGEVGFGAAPPWRGSSLAWIFCVDACPVLRCRRVAGRH